MIPCISLNTDNAAKAIGLSKHQLLAAKEAGEIPYVELGPKTFLFDPADLAHFLRRNRQIAERKTRIEQCKAIGKKVYFIQAGENGPIKIGYTFKNVADRLAGIQTGNHEECKILGVIPGDR